MTGAETRLGRFVGKARAFGNTLATAFAFVGPTVALYKFVGTVKKGFAELDKIAKDSLRLGLDPEVLQQFQFAADITGVSMESLTKAIGRMQKNISDAGIGLSTAKRALGDLGLEAEALKSLGVEQQFGMIADGLKQIPNEADRTRIAMDLFGRSGIELKTILDQGSEGINRLFAERAELGTLFDRDDLDRIQEANDAWTRMKQAIKLVGQQLSVSLSDPVKALAEDITTIAQGLEGKAGRGTIVQQVAGDVGATLVGGPNRELTPSEKSFREKYHAFTGPGLVEGFNSLIRSPPIAPLPKWVERPSQQTSSSGRPAFIPSLDVLSGPVATLRERAERERIFGSGGRGSAIDKLRAELFPRDIDPETEAFVKRLSSIGAEFLVKSSAAIAGGLAPSGKTADVTPRIGQAAALQRGTSAAFSQARQNVADAQRARADMEQLKEQTKTAEATEETAINTRSLSKLAVFNF